MRVGVGLEVELGEGAAQSGVFDQFGSISIQVRKFEVVRDK